MRSAHILALLCVTSAAVACGRASDAAELAQSAAAPASFVAHPDHIQPGLPLQHPLATLRNPYGNAKARVDEGAKLFISYNCADCHGSDGSGAMGPSLADDRWHFGGTESDVFESVYEGRPDGMPAWGARIDDEQIWALVSYVRSLSAGKNVSTENFTGHMTPTMGH